MYKKIIYNKQKRKKNIRIRLTVERSPKYLHNHAGNNNYNSRERFIAHNTNRDTCFHVAKIDKLELVKKNLKKNIVLVFD